MVVQQSINFFFGGSLTDFGTGRFILENTGSLRQGCQMVGAAAFGRNQHKDQINGFAVNGFKINRSIEPGEETINLFGFGNAGMR